MKGETWTKQIKWQELIKFHFAMCLSHKFESYLHIYTAREETLCTW
jgi:hypothetical protein